MNQFDNIFRLLDVLANFNFATSGPMGVTTYKHGIYELPHNMPNDLRLRNLENWEILGKCLKFIV